MSIVTTKRVSAPLDFTGKVEFLHLCPRAFLPMRSVASLTLLPGQGIDGDRYCLSGGFYSHKPEEGRQVTLFEIETLEALKRDHQIDLGPEEHRRNITVRGVPLNHLVGRRFWVGDTLLEATRLSTPCKHLEEITGKPVFDPLINRSGLNCKIVRGGKVYVNDLIRPYQAD
ncbi:hypothetical protein Sant_1980 [Sodalis praecaptivus]|uniref:MOSC domain-containing protein n=1 Tax=Sodalis praecaptivus TaxID=1239307 RepID=W0HXV3_9GAMM|nr:MOSC domain-containing protein [Sodalis praecaptivus]AHF77030.1 hypothetical protein Sant_1980 [Sodalis praecaptivus]